MRTQDIVNSFSILSEILKGYINNSLYNEEYKQSIDKAIVKSEINNPWFTKDNIVSSLKGIVKIIETGKDYFQKNDYPSSSSSKKIGVILAGNIPLVGFHDFFSVLATGNIFIGKVSSKDNTLLMLLSDILTDIAPEIKTKIKFVEKTISDFEAVIATGSNNSSRYFEYYFSKYPNIIRKNRNSIAILDGNETDEDLRGLAYDTLSYFGLGCRNVSKIFIPKDYKPESLFKYFDEYSALKNHSKYFNNYEYNRAIYLVNMIPHLDNGFFIIKEDISLHSSISVLHYEFYTDLNDVQNIIKFKSDNIQSVVSNVEIKKNCIKFGNSQFPQFDDFADDINTVDFLINL